MAEQSAFLTAYDEMQKKKREQEGFSAPAPMESVVDTVGQAPAVQSPFSQAAAPNPMAAAVDPMAQPDLPAAAPAAQAPAVQAETPFFQPTESGQRLASGVSSAKDAVFNAANLVSEAGGNFANSTSGAVADLINQSTGGRVNLQSPATSGAATKDNAGAPITDASQLRAFMSGLNEQAPASELVAEAPTLVPAAATTPAEAAPEVMGTPESIADLSVNGTDVVTPEAITEAGPVAPQAQAPQGLTTAGGQPLAEFLAGGQQKDAQGRMIDPNVDRSSFEQASADREARQAARPDFGEAQERAAGTVTDRERRAARGDGMSDADRRDIAKANQQGASASDIARGDKVAALNGVDRKTGKPPKIDGALTDYQKASLALRERELGNAGKKQTAAEAKAELIRKANPDLPEEEIAAITSGSVRVVQNPSTGETTLLNLATGASKKVNTGQETGLNFDVAAPENTLFSRAGEYTGAVEAAKRKGQGITGQFGVDIATDASIGAAQDFETAQNELVRAFRDSARYSATEANQLKKELNIALSPFEDPKTAEAKLRSIDKSLARRYKNEEAVALDENESIANREDARSRARAIAQFRATLGVPAEDAKPVEIKFDPKSLTGENQQAYGWATSNPSDPRSQAILAKLNSQ